MGFNINKILNSLNPFGGIRGGGPSDPKPSTSPMDEINRAASENTRFTTMKKGGMTASRRADGIAQRGKTKGRFV